jgi:hypothetical protein
LFDNVEQRLTIILSQRHNAPTDYYASSYQHWYVEERPFLLNRISYHNNRQWDKNLSLYKIGSFLEETVCIKLYNGEHGPREKLASYLIGDEQCYYHNAPTYFIRAMAFKPNSGEGMRESSHYKMLNSSDSNAIACVLNSSIYYWFFKNISNCRDYASREIVPFPIGKINEINFSDLGNRLQQSYIANRAIKNRVYPSGLVYYEEYYPAKSKSIIDEIDKVLAKHYGFTEEELDFIINYDIKYRMGDELDDNGGEEVKPMSPKTKPQQIIQEQKPEPKKEPKDNILTMIVRHETLERISSGEKTTFKRYLDDEEFAKQVLVTENGNIKFSRDHCPYTAKNITSIKLVCDNESIVKKVTNITFRSGINSQGKSAWKIIFHF